MKRRKFMDCKYNKKYFTGAEWPVPVGIICIIIGLIPFILMLMDIGHVFALITPAIILLLGGVGLILVSNGGRSNEQSIGEQIDRNTKSMLDDSLKVMGLEEKHVKVIPLHDPTYIGEFDFTGSEELLVKRGNDGKFRTNYFTKTLVMFTANSLCLYTRRLGLCDNLIDNKLTQIPYLGVEDVFTEVFDYKFTKGKNTLHAKYCMITFKDTNGETVTVPTRNDADVDKMVEDIKVFVEKKKAGKI